MPENKEGFPLEPEALGAMVKNQQFSYLKAYDGGEGLTKALGGNSSEGLSKSFNFEYQQDKYGKNYIEPPKVTAYWWLIWEGCHDVTIIMLVASAIVSLILGLAGHGHSEEDNSKNLEWVEGAAILITVVFVLNIQAFTDWSKAREFRAQQLELENGKAVHVIRDGKDQIIHPHDLVVGDIIRVAVGDILAVDAVLLHGADIKMDESALTGESTLIPKIPSDVEPSEKDESPFLLSGTNVMSGSGKAVVVAVGIYSLQGKILLEVSKKETKVETSMEHPDDVDKVETKGSKNCCSKCCSSCFSGIKAFFTFGNIDSGGNLVEKLNSLAIDVGKIGVIVATITFMVMVIRWSVEQFAGDNGRPWENPADVQTLLEFFVTAVTILVVAIPEGLPLAVTLSLAISMRRMMKDNNQVKHMDSCETMGSATTICSDKTGTLTQNRMTVMRVFIDGKVYIYDVNTQESVGVVLKKSDQVSAEFLKLFAASIALNSSSTSTVKQLDDGSWRYTGNATECALLKLLLQFGTDASTIRQDPQFKDPEDNLDWGIFTVPFSSSRKRMSWVVPNGDGYRLYSKGAPSYIFDSCASSLGADGKTIRALEESDLKACNDQVSTFQDNAMRTIAIAYRDFDEVPEGGWRQPEILEPTDDGEPAEGSGLLEAETKLTLIGVVGIEDPLRPTVVDAIKRCNRAGVDVRMCTGDALATAIAISKQCGILRERDLETNKQGKVVPKPNFAMTGAEFDERVHFLDKKKPKIKRRCFLMDTKEVGEMLQHPFMVDTYGNKIIDQREFDIIWPKLRVLARCQPEDKLTLVRGMRNSKLFADKAKCTKLLDEHGIDIFPDYQVVAVTGDGTNDAPALKNADVGFAMGIVGTDISKQACDIILLDDNFASIVAAAMWGRNVYDSISKFIQFQLTVNIVAIVIAVVGAFAFTASPLSAVQMLWVNLIMDSLASISLATEPPTPELLERKPYGKRRPIISRVMLFNMLGQAVYQLAVLLTILFSKPGWIPGLTDDDKYPPPNHSGATVASVHWTVLFNTFVQMQLFNQMNSRKLQTVERLQETWHEWNVFSGITKNPTFLVVLLIEAGVQGIIVQFAGAAFRVEALTGAQWGVCLALGVISLLWQFLVNAMLVMTDSCFANEQKVLEEIVEAEIADIDMEKGGEEQSRAQYHWDVVRTKFLTAAKFKQAIATDREDSWVLHGIARPYHHYDHTKEEQIRVERQISDTGRDLLGIQKPEDNGSK